MIKDEYSYNDISDYLLSSIELLISGEPREESRCNFFYNEWMNKKKDIITLNLDTENKIRCRYISFKEVRDYPIGDIIIILPRILTDLFVSRKSILVDITGLDHITIMTLTHILIKQIKPKKFFAGYVSPQKYIGSWDSFFKTLTMKIAGIMAVPGFAQTKKNDELVCTFIGFEGIRFKSIIEYINDFKRVIPIVAFPSENPHWFNITIWNSMDVINDYSSEYTIYKCSSESIYGAVILLKEIVSLDDNVVLVPIGTRPHSMACSIFASNRAGVRIIHDYAIENEKRSEGIANINIYHLTNFIEI